MKRLACVVFLIAPAALMGQKKDDILAIQRDIAILQDQVRQLQKSQDDKIGALQSMMQQTVDVSTKLSTGLASLQHQIDQRLSDEQSKVVAPVATLNTTVDQMADDFRTVSTNVAELMRRMAAMDAKLQDISNAVRTLSAPPAPPPGQPGAPGAAATQVPAASAETSYNNAYRDYSSGKSDLAMQEFMDYVKNFPDTADAPNAQFYIAYMYFTAKQYPDASKAFDDVLEKYPENPKTPDAMYYKAVSLQESGQRSAAVKTYKDFLAKYPQSDHVDQARKNLRTLGPASAKKR